MKPTIWVVLPIVMLAAPVSAAAPKKEEKPAVAEQAQPEPEKACKKKKGLGGLLRAARNSGLVSVVSGHAGTGAALVNSVASTAIDVADAGARAAPPEPPKC